MLLQRVETLKNLQYLITCVEDIASNRTLIGSNVGMIMNGRYFRCQVLTSERIKLDFFRSRQKFFELLLDVYLI